MVKTIIPCLDSKGGRVVKGVAFEDLRDAGDPVELAARYSAQGADELVYLDIAATNEDRETSLTHIEKIVKAITIPLTVGGGIRSLDEAKRLFALGVSKVSLNSAALQNPLLLEQIARSFGSERLVCAIDAKRNGDGYTVLSHGGNKCEPIDLLAWARKAETLGAGAILLTSKDADGVKNGYDLGMTKAVADAVNIPVIASGGCGCLEDFADAFLVAGAAGALAASLFHFGELTIPEVKQYLKGRGIAVRI